MNAIAAVAALSVAALTLYALLRVGVGGRLVADPSGERWHARSTPVFGGVGIFLGLVAGVGAAVAVGATDASSELLGILGGCAILFVAGFVDDVYTLKPVAKLAAQFAAAALVLASGLTVEIVGNNLLATAVGLVWLVGITNAFNLLDNMDGLAASLATVSCAVFAVAALDQDSGELALVVALALGGACLGFLPFNLRPGRSARVFMGDSGSQVIGFGLASLALASSWTTAGATLTSLVLPLLVLAVPILDTTLVTVRRTIERRPVTQGGTDHSSHRLVYYGLSEQQAVAALTLLALLLGATALAYNVLANARVTAVGVLISFVVLVQFASFLSDLQERSRREDPGPAPPLWRAFFSNPRRLVEVLDGLRDHLLLVPGVVSPVRRRRRQLHPARHLPRGAADPARRPLRALRRLRDLPADLALRVGPRLARDCRRGRAVGAAHDRNRPRNPSAHRLPAGDLLRRRVAVHDAGRGVTAGAASAPSVSAVRASRSSASSSSAPAARAARLPVSWPRRRRRASSGSSTTTRH